MGCHLHLGHRIESRFTSNVDNYKNAIASKTRKAEQMDTKEQYYRET